MAASWLGQPESDDGQGDVATEGQDIRALRRELKKLRRGKEVLAMRVKKARRELAHTRKKQKEAEKVLSEQEAAVAAVSQRLGYAAEGLPEIDEWRLISKEHRLRAKELKRQIEEEKAAHEEKLQQLQEELKRGGRPETEKSLQAEERRAERAAMDELCGRVHAVRDFLSGDLEGVGIEELRELFATEGSQQAPPAQLELGSYELVLEEALIQIRERHEQSVRDLKKLCNTVLGRKDVLLKALADNVLGRGLEDLKLCTPAELSALRELLRDVESVCSCRLRVGVPSN